MVDQTSLFIAAGVCALALALAMLSVWVHNREDNFVVNWMLGLLLIGAGVVLYYGFPPLPSGHPLQSAIIASAFTLEYIGFIVIYIAARQFTGSRSSWQLCLGLGLFTPAIGLPILAGYDGLGIMVFNFFAFGLLMITALQYWSARSEDITSIAAMSVLYGLTGISFFACAAIIAHERDWVLQVRPDNWAEEFNAMLSIAGITGIGALSLGLNNARAARRHRLEAQTDVLTGLLNRRALFERMTEETTVRRDAVVVFDLDNFKSINDGYGHATGDEVLRRFADALRYNLRPGDIAARSGGEEFVLVLRKASLPLAASTAERIRAMLAESRVDTANGPVWATASAGVALASEAGERFEDVLNRADVSLYRAKTGGRDRVVTELKLHSVRSVI